MQEQVLKICPSLVRGMSDIYFPYNKYLLEIVKQWPGSVWKPGPRCWSIDKGLVPDMTRLAKEYGLQVVNECRMKYNEVRHITIPSPLPGGLHEFQASAIDRICKERSLMLAFEMGLGKTRTAIEACKATGCKRILVVCPAIARQVWVDEIVKWWTSAPTVFAIWPGVKDVIIPPTTSIIVITSYEMLSKVFTQAPEGWDAIILDEIHYIGHGGPSGAKRTALCHELRKRNRNALRLGLTGTPAITEAKQLHSQMEFLWPSRFGYWTKFTARYCNVEATGFVTASGKEAKRVFGLNSLYAPELETRLSSCLARATKAEYAHLLPSLTTQTLRVDVPRSFDPRELVERFMRMDAHAADTEDFVRQHSNHKIGTVAQLAVEAAQGSSRVAVMVYLHRSAHLIAEEINRLGGHAEVFTGETVAKKRMASIKEFAAEPSKAIAVITMSSVRESVDLTAFSTIYFAELHPSPGLISQVCGRFHRLSSKLPVFIYLVIINGSYEELVASRLTKRLQDNAKIYKAGMSEDKIIDAFDDKRSDDEFRNHLSDLLKSAPDQE